MNLPDPVNQCPVKDSAPDVPVYGIVNDWLSSHMHTVGNGAQGTDMIESRQWYVLWGLVPINEVDTQTMADEATDYNIITEVNLLDAIINAFVGSATIYCRTVTVMK